MKAFTAICFLCTHHSESVMFVPKHVVKNKDSLRWNLLRQSQDSAQTLHLLGKMKQYSATFFWVSHMTDKHTVKTAQSLWKHQSGWKNSRLNTTPGCCVCVALTCSPVSFCLFVLLLPLCGWDMSAFFGYRPHDLSLLRPSTERAVGLIRWPGMRAGRSQVPLKSGHARPLCSNTHAVREWSHIFTVKNVTSSEEGKEERCDLTFPTPGSRCPLSSAMKVVRPTCALGLCKYPHIEGDKIFVKIYFCTNLFKSNTKWKWSRVENFLYLFEVLSLTPVLQPVRFKGAVILWIEVLKTHKQRSKMCNV